LNIFLTRIGLRNRKRLGFEGNIKSSILNSMKRSIFFLLCFATIHTHAQNNTGKISWKDVSGKWVVGSSKWGMATDIPSCKTARYLLIIILQPH